MSNENEKINKTSDALTRALEAAQFAAKHASVPPPPPASLGLPPFDKSRGASPPPLPPPTKAAIKQLATMLSRPPVQGLYYTGKEIIVDGYQFVECRFDNCRLVVNSSNFEFIDCVIDPSTVVAFNGDMMRVIQLYNLRSTVPARPFLPKVNKNGSVTISGDMYE